MPVMGQSLCAMSSAFGNSQSKEPMGGKCCYNIDRRYPNLELREDAVAIRDITLVSGLWPNRTIVDVHVRNGSDGGEWTRCRAPRPQRPRCSPKAWSYDWPDGLLLVRAHT